ncbi:signal peptidase I [Streptomyces sp. WM4235]|uniref:signal peptidase I n=1 Tax=Streptomyces sp. WM4235 TaxID=1415551 RepID=UPI0006AEED63|nr:signal peptidase I [Streptomyces sp. WM4235]
MKDELPRPWLWVNTASKVMIALAVAGFVAGSVAKQYDYGYPLLYEADGRSMAQLYPKGDLIAGEPVGTADIRRGDVVLFSETVQRDYAASVSRVVALGGDVLAHRPGEAHLTLNGKPLEEPHLPDGLTPQDAGGAYQVTVPAGRFAALDDGDSRIAFTRDLTEGGTLALPLSLIRGRVVGHTSDPTPRMAVVDGALTGPGPYLLPAGALGLITVRVVLRRRRARVVYPWSDSTGARR